MGSSNILLSVLAFALFAGHGAGFNVLHNAPLQALGLGPDPSLPKQLCWMRPGLRGGSGAISNMHMSQGKGELVSFRGEDGVDVSCYLVRKSESKGVLVLSDVLGYSENTSVKWFDSLAERGFTVLAPDLFRGKPWSPEVYGGATGSSPEYEKWRALHSDSNVLSDIFCAAKYLEGVLGASSEVHMCGFCYGGGRMLEALAGGVQARSAVAFYPTRVDEQTTLSKIKSPLLCVLGDTDPLISDTFALSIINSNPSANPRQRSCRVFEGCGHAFAHRPKEEEKGSAAESFELCVQWLEDDHSDGK